MVKLGSKVDKILTAQPVNMRSPPAALEDVEVRNMFSYSKFEFPLINDMSEIHVMLKALKTAFNFK